MYTCIHVQSMYSGVNVTCTCTCTSRTILYTYSIAQILPKFHLDIHCTKNVVRDKRMVWIRMVNDTTGRAEFSSFFLSTCHLSSYIPYLSTSLYSGMESEARCAITEGPAQ